jgi:hypothetical protein
MSHAYSDRGGYFWSPRLTSSLEDDEELKTSQAFPDNPTSDLILKSCDNTLFYTHIRNLSVHSSVFADANDCVTSGNSGASRPSKKPRETVDMTETAKTLELLLQFIYPRAQPNLSKLQFAQLSPLAEAAEKWKIHAAMTPCNIYMSRYVESRPLEILRYATLHDYEDLANKAASLTVDLSSWEVIKALPTDSFIRWTLYRDKLRPPSDDSESRWIDPPVLQNALHRGGIASCGKWISFESAVRPYFHRCVPWFDLTGILEENRDIIEGCRQCEQRYTVWKELYQKSGLLLVDPDSLTF